MPKCGMFVLALVFQTTNVHIISYIYCIYIAQIAHTDLTGLCSVNMVVSETRPPLGPLAPIFSHCGVSSGPGIDLRSAGDVACRAQHGLGGLGGCQQPNAGIRLTPHGANLLASGVPAEDFAGTSSGWNLLLKSAVMHW